MHPAKDAPTPPNTIPWPPIIYVGAAIMGVALHWSLPLPWTAGLPSLALAAIGLCLICAAIALEIATALMFRRHRTTIWPNRAASRLITEGPFSKSRNPIYLGNTLLVAGAGMLTGIGWLIVMALAAAVVVQKLAIEREERHLATRFGQQWHDYARRTPRWLLF